MTSTWDPGQYLAFADQRALPFHHLVAALRSLQPRLVLDVGCGPGGLTATLLERWPMATIFGLDSSAEMIEHARRREIPGRLRFELADVRTWSTDTSFDLILSNACLQWIADHERLLGHLIGMMARRATLAFQPPFSELNGRAHPPRRSKPCGSWR